LRLENPRMYQCSRVFAFIDFLAILKTVDGTVDGFQKF
jgi:hypothetical protein